MVASSFLLILGCSTDLVPAGAAIPVPNDRIMGFQNAVIDGGTVVVTRDTGWIGGACNISILINGKVAARISTGESVGFKVSAGSYVIGISGDPMGKGTCSILANSMLKESFAEVKQGGTVRFRISGDISNGMDLRATSM
jgi:hypothetical protein